jgi:type IV pilus assembly protein PilV
MKESLPRQQRGVLLLEVLIALLIFALGVLGLVGLQASAAKQSGQAKYRSDATLLANELIGQMWITSRNFGTLNAAFGSAGSGGAQYNLWKTKVQAELPGSAACAPIVMLRQIDPMDAIVAGAAASAVGLPASTQVTITMRWLAPGEPSATCDKVHNIVLTNEIR